MLSVADTSSPLAGTFVSVLWPEGSAMGTIVPDDTLHDLALDHVLERLLPTAPAAAEALRRLCGDEDVVRYRQALFRALEGERLRGVVNRHLAAVDGVARCETAARTSHDLWEGQLWHLQAVLRYTDAVGVLADELDAVAADARSVAIDLLAGHVRAYRADAGFVGLAREATETNEELRALRYNVLVRGARVTVAAMDDEPDLRESVLETFERFRDEGVPTAAAATAEPRFDRVQGWVLERVAMLHPEPFARLRRFTETTRVFRDETLTRFEAEVPFYLAYLDFLAPLRRAELPVCYPVVSRAAKMLDVRDTFDLALAATVVARDGSVVLNDLELRGQERILVISGPNQGGKTTAARTFGQLHVLAALGCPVPGRDATVFLCDRILTEFEREERLDDLEGRLGAQIQRMHALLGQATTETVVVLNEVFSSTALEDARTLTRDVLERIIGLGALAVCVTFIDELSRLDEHTVSMVSAVEPDHPERRTFRVERRAADGRAYARALAAVHGLTAEQIRGRLAGREDRR